METRIVLVRGPHGQKRGVAGQRLGGEYKQKHNARRIGDE
jgi:hypothetical protein